MLVFEEKVKSDYFPKDILAGSFIKTYTMTITTWVLYYL